MSRVGRKPIPIPEQVEVVVEENKVIVKGPKGQLVQEIDRRISVQKLDGEIVLRRESDHRNVRALHGLYRSLIANMIRGVTEGYEKVLEVRGMGYRAELRGNKQLAFSIGYIHPVLFEPPEGVTVEVQPITANPQNDFTCARIVVRGIDKALVGNVAARIRAIRPPDPYKGKGIRYANEVIRLKPGKSAKGQR